MFADPVVGAVFEGLGAGALLAVIAVGAIVLIAAMWRGL